MRAKTTILSDWPSLDSVKPWRFGPRLRRMQNPILDVIIKAPQLSALLRLMAIHKHPVYVFVGVSVCVCVVVCLASS